jgi:LPXTG-site transpeptidase (sortase) family protein
MTAQIRNISVKYFISHLALTLVVLAGLLGISTRPVSAGSCGPTVIVSSTADSGAGSLREAIAGVCANGTITFDRSLSGATITLSSELTIGKSMTIDGSTLTDQVTFSGGNLTRIFYINNSKILALKSIKVETGKNLDGGGIYNGGTLTITNSTIADNVAASGNGGGIYNDGSLTAINCTFSGNSTPNGNGGAIYNTGSLVVKNSTFSGNSSISGGGIFNISGGIMTLVNSSVFGNSSIFAIHNWGNMTIMNTILAGTIGGNDCFNTAGIGTTSSASKNNLIQTDSAGINKCAETGDTSYILGSDPKLSALADNGGPTQTLELQAGSPAIDKGDYAACLSVEGGKDQRSVDRKNSSNMCDIGAYEVGTYLTPLVITTIPGPGVVLTTSTSTLSVIFNKDMDADSATNPANYILVTPGADGKILTDSCLVGLVGDDKQIPINSVSYDSNSFTSTLTVNGGKALANNDYNLLICSTTSIIDTVTTKLNNGLGDTIFGFSVNAPVTLTGGTGGRTGKGSTLPATGFAPGKVTALPKQTAAYSGLNIRLEIPAIGVNAPVVGVADAADVTWLGHDAGWLNGTAFPTWAGNSVITGHVWDADNQPGLFADLKTLKYGDKVLVHAFKSVYTYEVRDSQRISPTDTRSAFRHEGQPWISLLTCEDFDADTSTYTGRRLVRAVLVDVKTE